MRTTHWALAGLLATLAVAGAAVPAGGQPAADKVEVRDVTYDQLAKVIRGYRGKAVLVDFWGLF